MAEFFRVKEAFAYGNDVATPGQIWSGDNPAYKGREHLFEPVEVAAARAAGTETASAAPGEVRSVSSKFKKKPTTEPAPEPPAKPEDPAPAKEEK